MSAIISKWITIIFTAINEKIYPEEMKKLH